MADKLKRLQNVDVELLLKMDVDEDGSVDRCDACGCATELEYTYAQRSRSVPSFSALCTALCASWFVESRKK